MIKLLLWRRFDKEDVRLLKAINKKRRKAINGREKNVC